MATNEAGPISAYVVENVRRLRAEREWSLARLAQELGAVGRPILTTGLHRLENGSRRVDVDDLIGLAAAFDVSPITLLLPFRVEGRIPLTSKLIPDAARAWRWLQARRPLNADEDDHFARADFQRRALPRGIRSYPPGPAGRELLLQDNPNARVVTVADLNRIRDEGEGGDDDEHPETP